MVNEYSKQGSDRAAELLEQYNLTSLSTMPLDVTKLAESCGVDVFNADLDAEGLDGFVLVSPGGSRAEITINATQSLNRRRFTCAHELGHVMQERAAGPPAEVGYVDDDESLADSKKASKEHRDEHSRSGTSPKELYANGFAAALLMPEKLVRNLHDDFGVREMARFFRVSEAAMEYRLKNLGLAAQESTGFKPWGGGQGMGFLVVNALTCPISDVSTRTVCGTPTSAWAWRVPDGRHPFLIRVCQQHETPGAAVIANLVTKIQDLQYQIDTAEVEE